MLGNRKGYKGWKKDLATWVHRYLRLHPELMTDALYEDMYKKFLSALVKAVREDFHYRKKEEPFLEKLIEVMADEFNKENEERVNEYEPVVEELRKVWELNALPFEL